MKSTNKILCVNIKFYKNCYGECIVDIVMYCIHVPFNIPTPLYFNTYLFHQMEIVLISLKFNIFLFKTIIFPPVFYFFQTSLFQHSLENIRTNKIFCWKKSFQKLLNRKFR